MRTTVTLDPDVEQLLQEAMRRQGGSFKRVINDAIRQGLGPAARERRRYVAPTHAGGPAPGVDPGRLNQLADELEDEALLDRLAGR